MTSAELASRGRTPRAVLFDLDDTLIGGSALASAVAQTCAALVAAGYAPNADSLSRANAATWARLWPAQEADWTHGRLTGAALRLRVWQETLSACLVDDDAAARFAAASHLALTRSLTRLFDDVLPCLAALGGHCALGIVSNGSSDDQRGKLAWFALDRRFEPIVVSAEIGIAKPDPAIFQLALDRLSLRAADVWHVGDSVRADVAGAQAAGITAVWLNRTGGARPPEQPPPLVEIATLAQLVPLIEAQR